MRNGRNTLPDKIEARALLGQKKLRQGKSAALFPPDALLFLRKGLLHTLFQPSGLLLLWKSILPSAVCRKLQEDRKNRAADTGYPQPGFIVRQIYLPRFLFLL